MYQKKRDESLFRDSFHKKGQVTVFIIIAILMVAIILFFYYYVGPNWGTLTASKPAFEACVEKELAPQIQKLSLTAGVANPTFTSMYLDENYTFVCYTNDYLKPCVVQYPFLKDNFEKALGAAMMPVIQKCYDSSVDDLRTRFGEVTSGTIKTVLTINPRGVNLAIDAPTVVSNDESSAGFSKFEVELESPIYTILMVANSIVQFETSYGDSDVTNFMFFYPDLTVQKIRRDDNVKLYIITDKKDIKYRFATRSYAWPPGYGGTFS